MKEESDSSLASDVTTAAVAVTLVRASRTLLKILPDQRSLSNQRYLYGRKLHMPRTHTHTHLEFPPLGVVALDGDVGFDLAETIEVKLSYERAELVVCEHKRTQGNK